MKLPRFVHKLYAILFGYFWDSCPVCGKYFGGHEKRGVLKVPILDGVLYVTCYSHYTCYGCKDKAKELSKQAILDIQGKGEHEA